MIFRKPKRKQAVIVQRSQDENGKPGKLTQPDVVQLIAGQVFLQGINAQSQCVLQIPVSDVAVAFIEDVPNG